MARPISDGQPRPGRPPAKWGATSASCESRRSPFAILGVPSNASAAQVKRAYRSLCAQYHPDVRRHRSGRAEHMEEAPNEAISTGAKACDTGRFLEIQEAYRTLKDRYARAAWERDEQDRERGTATSGLVADVSAMLGVPLASSLNRVWRVLGAGVLAALLIAFGTGSHYPSKAVSTLSEVAAPSSRLPKPAGRTAVKRFRPVPAASSSASPESALPSASSVVVPAIVELPGPPRAAPFGGGAPIPEHFGFVRASASVRNSVLLSPHIQTLPPATNPTEPENLPEAAVALPATGEWQGQWLASCVAARGADLYLGWLEIDGRARFRWRSLASDAAGSVDSLGISPPSSGDGLLLLRPSGGDRNDPLAVLERQNSFRRSLVWSPNALSPGAECSHWQLFADDASLGIEGVWVLESPEKGTGRSIAPDYVELSLARKGNNFAGQFVGRYRVPISSMESDVRFQFQASSPSRWYSWDAAGGEPGEVLVEPLGSSRLAVVWKRSSILDGRPRLSGGVAVLRRME